MEHFHDKLVPVQREVRGKGFAIHVQVVDVISALQGEEIQLNLLQLTTDSKSKRGSNRSNWTSFREIPIFLSVRVEERKQNVRLYGISQEFAVVQFYVQETPLVTISLPFKAADRDLQGYLIDHRN